MKALSLWQPWATLVWLRAKQVETRGWWTAYRGPLAIHAGMKRSQELIDLCKREPFGSVLRAGGFGGFDDLPRGGVICYGQLRQCVPTKLFRGELAKYGVHESAFGNYSDGRYAFPLSDIVRLSELIPYKGRQRWFDVPDDLLLR